MEHLLCSIRQGGPRPSGTVTGPGIFRPGVPGEDPRQKLRLTVASGDLPCRIPSDPVPESLSLRPGCGPPLASPVVLRRPSAALAGIWGYLVLASLGMECEARARSESWGLVPGMPPDRPCRAGSCSPCFR
ncbi:MAG: hypothetical protein MZU97_12370 [Bacillus subtilis]|nr:hypothetical protein [Bacillus subtilis]